MICPDPLDLDALVRGELTPARRSLLIEHLDGCESCASVVAELARARSQLGESAGVAFGETVPARTLPSRPPAAGLAPSIGRYRLHLELGSGGMGTVFEAYDPELARLVAIKVLHPDPSGDQAAARALLVREAQAMAQLAHPNVVAVFDVGTAGHQLFIAMELVRGTTLARYLQARRTRSDIVRAFAQAGRGLAAAHAAGLVHRDFKPANVLVGDDGRVRVTDFGLARGGLARAAASGEPLMTQAGAIVGTPSYMAPEQWVGHVADARSDQWSFGVALFEALAGRHPFPAASIDALRVAVLSGSRLQAPAELPRPLRTLLDRSLALRAEDRYPTMEALLGELDRESVSLWRRAAPYAVLVLGTGALAAAVAVAWPKGAAEPAAPAATPAACAKVADKLDEVWNDERRARVADKTAGSGPALRALDRYAGEWRAMRGEVCEAAGRKELSEELRDLRNACLDHRLSMLSGAVRAIDKGAQDPLKVVLALQPVADCADDDRVRSRIFLPGEPAKRARVEKLAEELEEAASLLDAGLLDEADPMIERLLGEAKALEFEPILAEAQYRKASLLDRRGDATAAEKAYKEAFATARASHHDEVTRMAAIYLVGVVGADLHRPAEAAEWIRYARAEVKRSGVARDAARLLEKEATVDMESGKFADARQKVTEALGMMEQILEPDDPDLASTHGYLGDVLDYLGDSRAGLEERRKALAIMEHSYGVDHPRTADYEVGVARVQHELEAYDDAISRYRKAIAVYDRFAGTEESESIAHQGVAFCLRDQGKPALAVPEVEKALALLEKSTTSTPTKMALLLRNFATTLEEAGRAAEGLAMLERAERILGASGDDPAGLADTYAVRASTYSSLHRYDDAIAANQKAIALLEAQYGPDHPELGLPLHNLGLARKKKGDFAGALGAYRRSVAVLSAAYPDEHPFVQQSLLATAWLLMDELKRPAEAIPLFERAAVASEKQRGPDHKKTRTTRLALDEAKKRAKR